MAEHVAAREPPADRAGLRDLISECNHRSYFNHQVSRAFGVPYAPNAARLPLRRHQYLRAVAIQERLATVEYLEKIYREFAAAYTLPRDGNLQLPVFLAAALAEVSSRAEILEALAQLRAKARDFRSHRLELDQAIREGNVPVVRKVRNALESDAHTLRSLIGYAPVMSALSAVLAAATGEPFVSSFAAALAVVTAAASGLSADARANLARRLLQPEYWFLTDVATSAKAMTNALPKIRRLWGLTPQELEVLEPRFKRIADLGHG